MLAGHEIMEINRQIGIDFVHEPGVQGDYHMPESLGSGGALFDYDNDGDLDIYLINGAFRDGRSIVKNHLYRQEQDGTFTDVSDQSGLGDSAYGMGCAVGDIDNDGHLDIYVSNDGPDQLFRNRGDGTFQNITAIANIDNRDWGCSVTFSDIDRDGYLDIYVVNYVAYDSGVICTDQAGRPDYCGPAGFPGIADKLFRNNGNLTFTDISQSAGIAVAPHKGLGVVSLDFNNDHYMDFYVSNDGENNQLWINRQNNTFSDRALIKGLAVNQLGYMEAGMGIAVGDVDNDRDNDLFVTHLRGESNTYYRNDGDFGFFDDTRSGRLAQISLPYTGFGTGFLDLNNDGDLDLAIANGRVTRGTLLTKNRPAKYWDDYAEPNMLFENDGSGQFDVAYRNSDFCRSIDNSRGLSFGDIDNDGDVDMLVTNEGGHARVYRNDLTEKGNWLLVRAVDPQLKRDALGARVTVVSGSKEWTRSAISGYSYLAANDLRVHFGLGHHLQVDRVEILWPDGEPEIFADIAINSIITLQKGQGVSDD